MHIIESKGNCRRIEGLWKSKIGVECRFDGPLKRHGQSILAWRYTLKRRMQQRPTLGLPSISRDANFLRVLPTVFQECWRRETSYDPEKWSPENPTHGQCAITALVVQDLLGGDLLKGKVNGADHYWNRLPDSTEFDLTRDQFGAAVSVTSPERVSRQYVLSFEDTVRRYEQLSRLFESALKVISTTKSSMSNRSD